MDEMMVSDPDSAMLVNVARCFEDAVGFLQRTPALPGDYALLLAEAKGILEGMGIRLGEGDFSILVWSGDGLAVLTPSGLPIACALAGEEHDDSVEGSAWFLTYEFTVPDDTLAATAVVELEIR